MKTCKTISTLTVILLLFGTGLVQASPALLRYQGFLADKVGTPVDGEWVVTFRLYPSESSLVPVFEETRTIYAELGVFSAVLGSNEDNPMPVDAFESETVYLGLVINGNDGPIELSPRQQVVSNPYAFFAGHAATCDQADNTLMLGGEGAASYVTLSQLPDLCVTQDALPVLVAELAVTEEELPLLLVALGYGPGAVTLEDVQAWMELTGYVPGPHFSGDYLDLINTPDLSVYATKVELGAFATVEALADYATQADVADYITGPEVIDAVTGSGQIILADGSVALAGEWDVNGNVLLNLAVQSCPDPEDIEAPASGQLCFQADPGQLVVFDGEEWIGVGGVAADLACDGCVDAEDVSFPYAVAANKGGAAIDVACPGCIEPSDVGFSWAAGALPGGDALKALQADKASDLECAGCVQGGDLAQGAVTAATVPYDDQNTNMGANAVQSAIEKLHGDLGQLNSGGEGHGQLFMQAREWSLAAYGKGKTYLHLFNPEATAKVLAYIYADEVTAIPGATKLLNTPFAPNAYSPVTGTKDTNTLIATKAEVFNIGSHLLIHQTHGQNAGTWELCQVSAVEGSTIVLTQPTTNDYTTGAQAVIATSYGQLVVETGGVLQPTPFNPSTGTGGILYVRAETIIVQNGGKVTATEMGFTGGSQASPGSQATQGGSECAATGAASASANCSGGGGGNSGGGGGGGNKTAGVTSPGGGTGGETKGDADLSALHFGGGGGGPGGVFGSGGTGGGIVVLGAATILVESGGILEATGGNGTTAGWTYKGVNMCSKRVTDASQVTAPGGCEAYTPNTSWGQSDFVAICEYFMPLYNVATTGCSSVDTDADGGLCSNYSAIAGWELNTGPDVWLRSSTFSWQPGGGSCTIVNESNDVILYACSNDDGCTNGSGGGAGGTVAVFAEQFINTGSIDVGGGTAPGGAGGDGWFNQLPPIPGIVHAMYPKGVELYVDGVNVTAALGDPNAQGTPSWDAADELWGESGTSPWSTGKLDLSAVANWTLGEHSVELRETGGAGGNLKLFLYTVYPFTDSQPPVNNTCAQPTQLFMDQAGAFSGTTEDIMGKLKATDNYAAAGCGGADGPEVVYSFTLGQYAQFDLSVVAAFDARIILRKGSCTTGEIVGCGLNSLLTEPLKPGSYFLFVDGDSASDKGDFTLHVTPVDPAPPAHDSCATPQYLDLSLGSAEYSGLTLFATNDYLAACGGVDGRDVVFEFDVVPGIEHLSVNIAGDFNPVMYLHKDSCGGSTLACVPGDSYSAQWPGDGTYYLVLDGASAQDAGEYLLQVTTE